ncbi:MAG: sortase [Clostridia bacterium]|nr:sortase [Clostridia bacterium]
MKKQKVDLSSLTPEEREARRKKNKRFNRILYAVSAVLILAGIYIIINDQTLWIKSCSNKIEEKYNEVVNNETPIPAPTMPPLPTADPDTTPLPWGYTDEDAWTEWIILNGYWNPKDPESTKPPMPTAVPGVTQPPTTPIPGDNYTPPKPVYGDPEPTPYNPYEPKNLYFVGYESECPVCPVQPVGYNQYGQMAVVQSAYIAGWFMYGGDPVRGGNTLIAGHIRHKGKFGYFKIVRDNLKIGDSVIVEMQNGQFAYYVVGRIEEHMFNNVPSEIMNTGGSRRLTLITCKDDYSSYYGTSAHRVFAICYPVYVDPMPTQPPATQPPEATPNIEVTPEPEQTPEARNTEGPTSAPPDPTRAP